MKMVKTFILRIWILCSFAVLHAIPQPSVESGRPPLNSSPAPHTQPSPTMGVFSEDPFPLRRVFLYTNGTAYFEREAMVSGTGVLGLYFRTSNIDDLLKSFVIIDPGSDSHPVVSYGSRDPIDRMLKSFSIDISDNPNIASLLLQPRGEPVEIWGGEKIMGTIFGVESRTSGGGVQWELKGNEKEPQTRIEMLVNLYTEQGLKSIPYARISCFRFLNPKVTEEIEEALQYLAVNRNIDQKRVFLSYTGSTPRTLKAAYMLETSVWKTTFRLVLGKGQKHLLQGWAIVENSTDENWSEVHLSLVSGRPISFSMNLYEPLYNSRPTVPYAVGRQLPPPLYSAGVAPAPVPSASSDRVPPQSFPPPATHALKRSRVELSSETLANKSIAASAQEEGKASSGEKEPLFPKSMAPGSIAQAEAAAVGQFIRYDIREPVSISHRQAALLQILNASVEGERLSVYNESVNRKHPLNGVWLENTTDLALMGWPITVFEGQYAGDARIDTISAWDKRLLDYAVDLDTEVLFLDNSLPEMITRIVIRRGTLHVLKTFRKERVYTVVNRGITHRFVLIEHPLSPFHKLVEPKTFEERTETLYRFRLEVPPKEPSGNDFWVMEARPLESTVALSNLPTETILFYVNQRTASPKIQEALSQVIVLRNKLSEAIRARQELETCITQITREQERIRSNMAVLDKTSSLYQRYLKTLGEQEDTLADLQKKLSEIRSQENLKRKGLNNYLSGLEVE